MADAKISQLPVATTPLAGTELVPLVQGGVTVQSTVDAILTGTSPSGTANGVLYLNASKVVTSGSALTYNGTNFGVGGAALEKFAVIGTNSSLNVNPDSSGTAVMYAYMNSVYNALRLDGLNQQFYVSGAEQMRLDSTGLGIGTSSPLSKLVVSNGSNKNLEVQPGATTYLLAYDRTAGDYLPLDIAAEVLVFSTNNGTERMRLDSSGNLGLDVTPSGWGTSAFQTKVASVWGFSNNAYVGCNYYFDGTDRRYIATAAASEYAQFNGQHTWYTAPSGTAGNPITFSQVMTLDASGNLGIGTSSPSRKFEVNGISRFTDGTSNVEITNGGGVGYVGPQTNHPLAFQTNNTERARIPAAGGMVVGTAALATTATDGFLYVPTCAGTPTGTPTTQTGTAPIVVDTTNNKLYFYSGGQWRDAGP